VTSPARASGAGPVPARLPDGAGGSGLKARESPYRGGRFDRWIKVKDPKQGLFDVRLLQQYRPSLCENVMFWADKLDMVTAGLA